jgi:hypothetical protein
MPKAQEFREAKVRGFNENLWPIFDYFGAE